MSKQFDNSGFGISVSKNGIKTKPKIHVIKPNVWIGTQITDEVNFTIPIKINNPNPALPLK